MELNECINFLLTKAQHTVFQYLKTNLAQFDVTPVQYGILKCLWDEDGQTPKQIARTLSLDGSTITGILDRMENKNLVRRTPDPDDRRTLKVVITNQGRELRECIEEVIEEVNKRILEIFTSEEQEQLKKFLEQIANRQVF
ncbi:MarR family winged helix-turn-helix transcriptional regulator [Clostridium aciditolerans]|uniref:MarR family transcriptional regulator n=1 Tax=Clostridium aciditolerans TaxID=339861 RepID=A0A934HUV0_9CLOT|nr:MarR family transcriptional regulator [Clostridium aciditolerans]MBI6872359.1 MarR family transcriptional regulator [Clostridium aciditolerans]